MTDDEQQPADTAPASTPMTVSVIIPAHNGAATIAATLDSLLAQEWQDWRAIVVENGSTDDTRAIADDYASRDGRIRVTEGPQRGAGAARNFGLAAMREPWVLFLDSDDTLAPGMMRRMMEELAARPDADAVHCGWTFTDLSGDPIGTARCTDESADLFPVFARYCAFAIHACIFRRELLDRAGGFDEGLVTSEDFDLWQRLARLGARFAAVDEYLVTYRLRSTLSWFDIERFLDDALTVVARGHAADPRLEDQTMPPAHRPGMPQVGLFQAQLQMVVWAAGIQIARGHDATPLVARLPKPAAPSADSDQIADSLLRGVPLALCRHPTAWLELWPEVEGRLLVFLQAIECHLGAPDLARRVASALEMRVVKELRPLLQGHRTTIRLNATVAVRVEVQGELHDLILPDVERAICFVFNYGNYFGLVVLPVFDRRVPAIVLKDAIAARFAWPLLESLFSTAIYPGLAIEQDEVGWTVRRSSALAAGLDRDPREGGRLHDAVGWAVFVQELLGLPDWTSNDLYDWTVPQPEAVPQPVSGAHVAVELSEPLPQLTGVEREIDIEVTIGGATMFLMRLAPEDGEISAARIRAATLDLGKMELARVAVREGIVGFPQGLELPLRERLERKAQAVQGPVPHRRLAGNIDADRLSRYAAAVANELGSPPGTWVIGTARAESAAEDLRRAALPPALTDELGAALGRDQPAVALGADVPGQLLYLPDLIARTGARHDDRVATHQGGEPDVYGRHHFETLFAKGADPWKYTSPYEQTKYEQTLSMLPALAGKTVLEIGCAEGHFTRQLAPLVGRLVATDISELALARAAERCAEFTHIDYRQLDLAKDEIPGRFDLIVCSELLYYMGDLDDLAAVGAKLAGALANGGYLVTAHANLVVDDPGATGFDWAMPFGAKAIGETFAQVPGLLFDRQLSTPLYRIQRFRKRGWRTLLQLTSDPTAPRRSIAAMHADPEPDVARHILWSGGSVRVESRDIVTAQLPILMYHAVSDAGPPSLSRWRVTPADFEAQVRYLSGAGFEPASLAEWQAARSGSQPLPGRRVLITFDDVYADFEEHALPILRKYGFPATLFVPAAKVGGAADWDAWSGTALPLIGWDGLKRLRDAGLTIGSHGVSHRMLSGLAPSNVAEELWQSRRMIERALDIEVNAVAYPFGGSDEIVEHLAGACGYRHGLTTRHAPSSLTERDFSLSRIEVFGDATLEDFIRALPE